MSDHKLNATLKAGASYDAPWLTIGSDDPAELHSLLTRFAGVDPSVDTAAAITAAATKLQGFWTAKDTLGAAVVSQQPVQPVQEPVGPATAYISQQAAPQAPPAPVQQVQQAATPPAPSCIHGQMLWKTGVSKDKLLPDGTVKPGGSPWKGWFCTAPKGSSCPPQFIR